MPREAESRRTWARRRGYAVLRATGLSGLLALVAWVPAAGQEGAEARVTADRLNFREECGMSSPVLGVLTRDETVTVLGSELGTWIRVRNADGEEGCVSAQYLEIGPAPAEAESMAAPSEDPSPYAWADLTDPDSAEIVSEIEELDNELTATSDPDEQEDLRQEISELEDDLHARQEELAEEREEEAREARDAELVARQEEAERRGNDTRRTQSRSFTDADWTGFYIGFNAGYGSGSEITATSSLGRSSEGDIDGILGGVQVGYSHQFSRFVVGGEADFQISDQSGSTGDLADIGFPGSSLEIEYESFGTVRARVGFAPGRALLYVAAGYAYLDAESSFTGPLGDVLPRESVSFGGLVAGLGVEARLTSLLSFKGEALYFDFDDEPELAGDQFYIARVGVNWRF